MATIKTFTVTANYDITSENEPWRGTIDEGMSAPSVTGGSIDLPQGGQRESKAAVTGGIFTEGSEAGSDAEGNARKIIDSILPEELGDTVQRMIDGDFSVHDLEFFLTNIVKSQYQIVAGEYSDNPDEAMATQQVIDSLQVKLTIEGLPTKEEIVEAAKEAAVSLITDALGGVSK